MIEQKIQCTHTDIQIHDCSLMRFIDKISFTMYLGLVCILGHSIEPILCLIVQDEERVTSLISLAKPTQMPMKTNR